MILVVKKNPDPEKYEALKQWLLEQNVRIGETVGENHLVLSLIGDTASIDADAISSLDIVESVKRIQEPYKKAHRVPGKKNTVVQVKDTYVGDGTLTLLAGPCSIESEEQIVAVAKAVKEAGATMLRGGAYKPRTSPYSFQGMGREGLELLSIAKKETGLPIVTEIMDPASLALFDDVDVIQVGTRNMQNFALLKELGKQDKPVLLKRGMNATYEELLMSAEYIMNGGNENVILCERGIRTFENYTRNTLDLSAIPVLKKISHLPVIVDPSHATGKADLVGPMSLAAIAAGADGVMVEVHNDPEHAWCDGPQSVRPEEFAKMAEKMRTLHAFLKKM